MTRRTRIREIIRCCEKTFNRGSAFEWKHSDYLDLNKEIIDATGLNISASTLKRIFGKVAINEEYVPQRATIEALSTYGRYIDKPIDPAITVKERDAQAPQRNNIIAITIGAISLIALILVIFLFNPSKSSNAQIKLEGTEGTLPLTAFLQSDVLSVSDSVFLNYGDKTPLVHLSPGLATHAHNYLIPGVFTARIQTRKKILSSTIINVSSNGWVGLGFHRQANLSGKYFAFPATRKGPDSLFFITNQELNSVGLDTAGSFFTRLANFGDVGEYSDSFNFETTFFNKFRQGLYCSSTQFQISGEYGLIRFKLVKQGCSSFVINVLSEKTFNGKENNLSRFVTNLEKWNTVKILNKNKKVSFYLNGVQVFNKAYQNSIGKIKGVFVEFEGNGFVKKCELKSTDGKLLFHF